MTHNPKGKDHYKQKRPHGRPLSKEEEDALTRLSDAEIDTLIAIDDQSAALQAQGGAGVKRVGASSY
jgi:hypothetical protein